MSRLRWTNERPVFDQVRPDLTNERAVFDQVRPDPTNERAVFGSRCAASAGLCSSSTPGNYISRRRSQDSPRTFTPTDQSEARELSRGGQINQSEERREGAGFRN